MSDTLTLIHEPKDDGLVLRSPAVGLFTCAVAEGQLLSPGSEAGVLKTLEQALPLIVPEGVQGRVVSARPERVHEPVGYGAVLYELAPLAEVARAEAGEVAAEVDGGLPVFRSPWSGRFWHRPAPGEPAFVEPGGALEVGKPVGLIEVMKTFTQVVYRTQGSLPEKGRMGRFLVEDGAEVEEGEGLIELEAEAPPAG